MHQKTVIIQTDGCKLKTGFAKYKRAILRHLHKTGKYRIVEAVNGVTYDAPELSKMPWEAYGTAPALEKQQELANIQDPAQREAAHRIASYGGHGLERIVKHVKPDILLTAQDSWGLDFIPNFSWADKLTFIPHCTIDSEPLMPQQIDLAAKVDTLYLWASFGVRLYEQLGYKNVKHLYGCVETDKFFPVEESVRNSLRQKFGLSNSLVGVNCFRNQTRKSIPNLLDGFKLFKEKNPSADLKLVLVTSLQEGWDIVRLIQDRNINPQDVYFAYYCRQCRGWEVRPFCGHDQDCPLCGSKGTFNTVNISHGVEDEDLNLIYNLSDFGLGVFNSGGLEIPPAIEMKLAGLPVLSTSYSCGEDIVKKGALALDWAPTYEFGSSFLKASTLPSSICERFEQLFGMTREQRVNLGKEGREYVLENMSPEVIGGELEKIFDAAPFVEWKDSDFDPKPKNPAHNPPQGLSPQDFVLDIFKNILHEKVDKNTSHVKQWTEHLTKSKDYTGVLNHFKNLATQHNAQLGNKPIDLADLLDKDDESRRICVVMPESAGDLILVNSLLNKFKALYPEFNLYFFTKPEFFELIEHHPAVHKVLPYSPVIDDMFFLTGRWNHKGYFQMAFMPHYLTQRTMGYQNNHYDVRAEWLNRATMS